MFVPAALACTATADPRVVLSPMEITGTEKLFLNFCGELCYGEATKTATNSKYGLYIFL